MSSSIQSIASETEVTSEQSKCSVVLAKDRLILDKARVLSRIASNFVKNSATVLYGKGDFDKSGTLVFHLMKKLLNASKYDKCFKELINDILNLQDTLTFSNALTCSRQNVSYEQFLNQKFYPIFQEIMNWNATSNVLTKEIILNNHFASRTHMQSMEMNIQRAHDWRNKLNDTSKKDFFNQLSVPALDFVNENRKEDRKLNLLCVFTNETDHEETSSDFNKMLHDQDIRMILPMTWNIVVAHNVLTISDENNQHITIYFRNPLKAKFDYKYSNLSLKNEFRFNSLMNITSILKERVQRNRMKKLNSPYKKTITTNQEIEPVKWQNDKATCQLPKQIKIPKKRNNSFLLLREPILLNCVEQNKTRQVLMYKAHSLDNLAKDEKNNITFSKTLEELLAKSIQYEGEPIHLIFEPLKLISRLKKEERVKGLIMEKYHKCKHNLIRSPIYKKILQYKNIQILRDTPHENQAFMAVGPKNECSMQEKTISDSGKSLIKTIHSCLDLPKNFSTSFTMKNFDLYKSTYQETNEYTGDVTTKPVITTHICTDLAKNFPASYSRTYFDINELFGENCSKFRRKMNTTALKQVNVKRLVASVFKHFFHFYSLLGGNLKSGTVITRSSSNYWLQVAGVAKDSCTLRLAGELFTIVAGRKVVLNIFDYIKFLMKFAMTRRLIITELVKQMMVCEELSKSVFNEGECKLCTALRNKENVPTEFCPEANHLQVSQSLPNIWPPQVNSKVGNRSCFNQEIF